jgi:hypothetical protein
MRPAVCTPAAGYAVEALNCVDCGTSLLVWAQVRADCPEETALAAVAELVREHGLPEELTVDCDPRFVGAPGTRDFPSPFVRFLTCLGVTVRVTPPARPASSSRKTVNPLRASALDKPRTARYEPRISRGGGE